MALGAQRLLALLSLLAASQAAGVHSDSAPIGKVVKMLQDMLKKGKEEKIKERTAFAKFRVYCDRTRKETGEAITTATDNIAQQKADIGKALSDVEVLAEDIKEQQADVAKEEGELDEATKLRKKERTDYMASHKDFEESIEAIKKATEVLKKKDKDIPQSLLQVQKSSLVPLEAKAAIRSFLVLSESVDVEGPPKANAYEFQSGGVVAILEKLKLKFEDQKTTLEKEEASAKAAYELLKEKLTDSIKDGKDTISAKTTQKAKRKGDAADTKGDLEVTTKGKAADEKKLSDLNVECNQKSEEYDKNQVTRADEIKAMETAVGILDSDAVSGTAKKHKMAAALLEDDATSFAQLRRSGSTETDTRRRLVALMRRQAEKLGSKYLSLVAARAVADPMGKVKKMIQELIVKLLQEANSEADNKGYCDSELATNQQTRDAKSNDVDELTAQVEKLTADLAKTKEDISSLGTELSDLTASQKKASELRSEEKAVNTETIAEAKGAQVAVERATQVLKEFYAKASDASLLQESDSVGDEMDDEMDEASSAPYKGMQSSKGGIIGMLEVVLSDFAKLESTTSSAEDDAATKYNKFMDDTATDIDVKGVEMSHLEGKKQTLEESLRNSKKELKATQGELDAALDYYDKLKPDCVDTGVSYQDRVEMRQSEIQSLQEAMKILGTETEMS